MENYLNHKSPDFALMKALTGAIDTIGSNRFPAHIADILLQSTRFDEVFICVFFKHHKPRQIFCDFSDKNMQLMIDFYLQYAYLLDPFYEIFKDGVGNQVVPLKECVSDNFCATEYYKIFYANYGLLDEYAMFIDFGGSASLVFSLGRCVTNTVLDAETKPKLQALLPVIAALCHRHWPQLYPSSLAGSGRMRYHLEKNVTLFGSSKLSHRETEIVKFILKGHSSKAIARILGNSPETIKVHRKNIYAKMNIASQGELFALFLDALSQTPPNSTGDPLNYLLE